MRTASVRVAQAKQARLWVTRALRNPKLLMYRVTLLGKPDDDPATRFLVWDPTNELDDERIDWVMNGVPAAVERVPKLPRSLAGEDRLLVADLRWRDVARLGRSVSQVRILGEGFFGHVAVWNAATLQWRDGLGAAGRRRIRDLSATRYQAMIDELAGDRACILTTGPSVDDLDIASLRRFDVRIACNSAVANRELLQEFRPNVFAFGDAAFHYGPSAYAQAFRRDLCQLVEDHNPWLVTAAEMLPVLEREIRPEYLEKVVPVLFPSSDPNLEVPTGQMHQKKGNVLTTYMLPVATRLAGQIAFAGCDGRAPDDDGFWKHSSSVQYDDLYQTVVDAHPRFFSDVDYVEYYLRHCATLDAALSSAQAQGSHFVRITPSYIPALKELEQV